MWVINMTNIKACAKAIPRHPQPGTKSAPWLSTRSNDISTVTIQSPISEKTIKQISILYADDTNIWVGLDGNDNYAGVTCKAQKGINQWGEILIVVGGALNPAKCLWTVHGMVSHDDRTWEYRDGEQGKDEDELDELNVLDNLTMEVPQLSVNAATIERLKSGKAVENLWLIIYWPVWGETVSTCNK